MTIGIICSIKSEMKSILSKMDNVGIKSIMGFNYYIGTLEGKKVVVVKNIEGKVNAAYCTTLLLSNFEINYLICLGVAIPTKEKLKDGCVVVSNSTVEADLDTTELGYDLGYEFYLNDVLIQTDEKMSNSIFNILKNILPDVEIGNIATLDKIASDRKTKEICEKNFNSLCFDMESGSINHVCNIASIPFCSIKVMTNVVKAETIKKNISIIVDKLNLILVNVIKNLDNN